MSARSDSTALVLTTIRNGRMTFVRHYSAREIDRAVADRAAIVASGADVQETIVSRTDGLGLSPEQIQSLQRQEASR
jgi:hypothetical protein